MRALTKPELILVLEAVDDAIEFRADAVDTHRRMWGSPAIPSRQAQRQSLLDSEEQTLGVKTLLKALLDGDTNGH